jgi:hypothetical protein
MTTLYPGTLSNFNDSMAKSIEDARAGQGVVLPGAPQSVINDRRKLFIAIAEGVIRYLQTHEDAFEITVDIENHPAVTVHPDIQVRFT